MKYTGSAERLVFPARLEKFWTSLSGNQLSGRETTLSNGGQNSFGTCSIFRPVAKLALRSGAKTHWGLNVPTLKRPAEAAAENSDGLFAGSSWNGNFGQDRRLRPPSRPAGPSVCYVYEHITKAYKYYLYIIHLSHFNLA